MPDPAEPRVAVYIDFDNIVISRYNQLYGKGKFHVDGVREVDPSNESSALAVKASGATVDIGAVLDFASSFGTIVLSRAYADWSVPVNAAYSRQLISRAVDLTQLFPTTPWMKNGADIRLAVDVVEDLFRLSDLSHVVIVAGDSDYIALAQRCKRLGRYVVGIGVAGATSKALAAACDEFADYDALPGVSGEDDESDTVQVQHSASVPARTRRTAPAVDEPATPSGDEQDDTDGEDPQEAATGLLTRALRLGHAKDDAEWLHSSAVKTQMKRMDPSFNEKALGFRSFSDFVNSRSDTVELTEDGQARLMRLLPQAAPAKTTRKKRARSGASTAAS